MPRGIGRGGAGVCTMRSQSRQDFFGRWISTTFSLAAMKSRISATSSPTSRSTPPQRSPGSSTMVSRGASCAMCGWLAAAAGRDALFRRRGIGDLVLRRFGSRIGGGGGRRLEVFEGELQLLDLALDLLRTRPVLLLLQPGDGDLERLDQRLVGAVGRRDPGDLPMLGEDDRPQGVGVVR